MQKPIFSLGLSFLLILSACNNTEPEADILTGSANTSAKADTAAQPQLRNGTYKQKNKSSQTTSEISYKDGKKDGVAKAYYPNGKLWKESPYKKGSLNGVAKVYDRKGRLQRTVTYKNGQKHGKYTRYFKSGNPRLEIEYDQGLPLPGYIEKDYTGAAKDEPNITVKHEDHLATREIYLLEIGLSKPHQNMVVYAFQDPADYTDRSKPNRAFQLPVRSDKAFLPIEIPRGYFYAQEIYFFVEYEVAKGIKVVKQKKLNLAVENNA